MKYLNHMKKIILLGIVFIILLFTGCAQVQPEIKVIKEVKVVTVKPDNVNYEYIATPSLPADLESMDMDEALDATIAYSIKLQSVIQQYEARVDSLKQWIIDIEAKEKEIRENK